MAEFQWPARVRPCHLRSLEPRLHHHGTQGPRHRHQADPTQRMPELLIVVRHWRAGARGAAALRRHWPNHYRKLPAPRWLSAGAPCQWSSANHLSRTFERQLPSSGRTIQNIPPGTDEINSFSQLGHTLASGANAFFQLDHSLASGAPDFNVEMGRPQS